MERTEWCEPSIYVVHNEPAVGRLDGWACVQRAVRIYRDNDDKLRTQAGFLTRVGSDRWFTLKVPEIREDMVEFPEVRFLVNDTEPIAANLRRRSIVIASQSEAYGCKNAIQLVRTAPAEWECWDTVVIAANNHPIFTRPYYNLKREVTQ